MNLWRALRRCLLPHFAYAPPASKIKASATLPSAKVVDEIIRRGGLWISLAQLHDPDDDPDLVTQRLARMNLAVISKYGNDIQAPITLAASPCLPIAPILNEIDLFRSFFTVVGALLSCVFAFVPALQSIRILSHSAPVPIDSGLAYKNRFLFGLEMKTTKSMPTNGLLRILRLLHTHTILKIRITKSSRGRGVRYTLIAPGCNQRLHTNSGHILVQAWGHLWLGRMSRSLVTNGNDFLSLKAGIGEADVAELILGREILRCCHVLSDGAALEPKEDELIRPFNFTAFVLSHVLSSVSETTQR